MLKYQLLTSRFENISLIFLLKLYTCISLFHIAAWEKESDSFPLIHYNVLIPDDFKVLFNFLIS